MLFYDHAPVHITELSPKIMRQNETLQTGYANARIMVKACINVSAIECSGYYIKASSHFRLHYCNCKAGFNTGIVQTFIY